MEGVGGGGFGTREGLQAGVTSSDRARATRCFFFLSIFITNYASPDF